jgi:hypothetical protein
VSKISGKLTEILHLEPIYMINYKLPDKKKSQTLEISIEDAKKTDVTALIMQSGVDNFSQTENNQYSLADLLNQYEKLDSQLFKMGIGAILTGLATAGLTSVAAKYFLNLPYNNIFNMAYSIGMVVPAILGVCLIAGNYIKKDNDLNRGILAVDNVRKHVVEKAIDQYLETKPNSG